MFLTCFQFYIPQSIIYNSLAAVLDAPGLLYDDYYQNYYIDLYTSKSIGISPKNI